MNFRVTTSDGKDLGIWAGDYAKDALDTMAREAGFYDYTEACDEGHFDDSMIKTQAVQ
jgi:hypothetical protein